MMNDPLCRTELTRSEYLVRKKYKQHSNQDRIRIEERVTNVIANIH